MACKVGGGCPSHAIRTGLAPVVRQMRVLLATEHQHKLSCRLLAGGIIGAQQLEQRLQFAELPLGIGRAGKNYSWPGTARNRSWRPCENKSGGPGQIQVRSAPAGIEG